MDLICKSRDTDAFYEFGSNPGIRLMTAFLAGACAEGVRIEAMVKNNNGIHDWPDGITWTITGPAA